MMMEGEILAREIARQKAVILRGTVDVISERELEGKLAKSLKHGTPLRVKLGVDPTSSALHLGFTVVLNKLRAFQDLGHHAVLIIGEGTAMVGDPTGRDKMRPRLTRADVKQNAETYLEQASRVLDLAKAEVVSNGDWLFELGFEGMIQLAARRTVAQMLERDDFQKRYQSNTAIYLHEFLYPLLQGIDSVEVRADVELGGTDQLFNLLVGRDLQEQDGQERQVCITTPLLVGLDGQKKMSKSYGNWIGISESPADMFMKVMRIDDGLIRDYFVLTTRLSEDEIQAVFAQHTNPRFQKEALGRALVTLYHGADAAEEAAQRFQSVVSNKEIPDDLPVFDVALGDHDVIALLVSAFSLTSNSEARRLITQGAVTLNGEKIIDPKAIVALSGGDVLRAGKKLMVRCSDGRAL